MRSSFPPFVCGVLLAGLGGIQSLCAVIDALFLGGFARGGLLISSAVTIFAGGLLALSSHDKRLSTPDLPQVFFTTTLAWVCVCIFGAMPLFIALPGLSFVDAFFEAVSGFTTTGSTVLVGLETLPKGILLWRAVMQWMGGIGIIVLAIFVLPFLKIGGMQLFHAESSDKSAKPVSRIRNFMLSLLGIYGTISLACFLAYLAGGMSLFDAATHAMTTISTGGFANYDSSFAAFKSPALEWTCCFFMIMGALPFTLILRAVLTRRLTVFRDEQVLAFFAILAAFVILFAAFGAYPALGSAADALRHSVFTVVTVMTTTGFASIDYNAFGPFSVMLMLFLTYFGACAGSTSGGLKVFRIVVVLKALSVYVSRLRFRRGVFGMTYNGHHVDEDLALDALSFLCIYVTFNTMLAVALSLCGLDLVTAISGAATALANVGPGLGSIIGPAGNFSSLNDAAKWLLSAGMLIGRLEFIGILVFFLPVFWRQRI